MNENVKTMCFVGAAVAVLLVAWTTRPAPYAYNVDSEIGKEFFPKFSDPLTAASMEITEYDEKTATEKPFKVAKAGGIWSLPSKLNYPADAERQLAEAAVSIMGLKKLSIKDKDPGNHAMYGVVDPSQISSGATGVGKRVTLRDASDKILAQFIIGNQVDKEKHPDLRYIRVPKQDVVYTVVVKSNRLTTKFEDWIEEDLLKLNSWDIREVDLHNYSIDEVNRRINEGEQLKLTYNDKDSKWSLAGLAAGEELNTEKINAMKNSLDDLKIVDVERKPLGLSRELTQQEGIQLDMQGMLSLQRRGFFIVDNQLLSNEGEITCRMKDGVQYVLRFGEIAAGTEEAAEKKDEPAAGDETASDETTGDATGDADSTESGANRFIFVTAQFNPELIPPPELKPLPGDAAPQPAAADAPAEAGEKAAEADQAKETTDAERKRIEEENKKAQEEYDKKIEEGKKRVDELNRRFADWYYVISDKVYRSIHLSRADMVKAPKEEKSAEEKDVEDFNQLKQGLEETKPKDNLPQSEEVPNP